VYPSASRGVAGDSARFDIMSSSDVSIRGFHFVYVFLGDGFVFGLACLVAKCCVGGLIEVPRMASPAPWMPFTAPLMSLPMLLPVLDIINGVCGGIWVE
jgi:hypothetical protein